MGRRGRKRNRRTATVAIQVKGSGKMQSRSGGPRKKNLGSTFPLSTVVLGSGFPKKMLVTLRYNERIQFGSVAGARGDYIEKCNGLNDPNSTGAGHQPYYYDQLAALYDQYCVIGSKIVYKIVPISTTQGAMQVTSFINDDNTVTPADPSEYPGAKTRILPAGTNNVTFITNNWSAKKSFGGSVLSNNSLSAAVNADPTELSTFTLSCFDVNGVSSAINVLTEIIYIVMFSELHDVAQS